MINEKLLTVRQLVVLLLEVPKDQWDLPVLTEGCDCWGDAAAVVVRAKDAQPYAIIIRGDQDEADSDDGKEALNRAAEVRNHGA